MIRVIWATMAVQSPMGQQRYEQEIQAAIRRIRPRGWEFGAVRVASARSKLTSARRVPTRLNTFAPLPLSRAIGGWTYGRPGLVHRFDLRLPVPWGKEVVTVHDLPPLRFDDEGKLSRSALGSIRRAARVIVPSQFAAQELTGLARGTAIDVIPYGLSATYLAAAPASDDLLARYGIRAPFVMHAAGATARKNLRGLAAAWRAISAHHEDLTLLLCGPSDARRDAAFAGAARVVKVGRLAPETIAALMGRASVVVVPSIYEGFGLPALEGMASGVPVVAAKCAALPEVCGDCAVLVAPDGDSIAAGIDRVLGDAVLARKLRERGPARAREFSWEKAAAAHLRVYHEVLGDSP